MNNKSFLNGFKEIFSKKENLSVVATMMAIVFIIVFFAMGGCNSCGSCNGCADGCNGGIGGKADYEVLYEDSIVSSTSLPVGEAQAATIFYPADEFTYSSCPVDSWPGLEETDAIWANDRFAITVEECYISNMYNSATGAYATNIDELFDAVRFIAENNGEPAMDITLGDKTGLWRVYAGWLYMYFPVETSDDQPINSYVEINVVPANQDRNSNSATASAAKLMYDEDVRAIIGSMTFSAADAIPGTDEVVFRTYSSPELISTGEEAIWPALGGTVIDVDKTVESGDYKIRLDSIELTKDADDKDIVTYNIEFINGSEAAICANNAFSIRGYQNASMDLTGSRAGGYIWAKPGQSAIFQKSYILNSAESSIKLEVYQMNPEEDGTYSFGELLDTIVAVEKEY